MQNFEIGITTRTMFASAADIAALEGGGWFHTSPQLTPRGEKVVPLECVTTVAVADHGHNLVSLSTHYVLPSGLVARGYWKRDSAPSVGHMYGCWYCGYQGDSPDGLCPSCGAP